MWPSFRAKVRASGAIQTHSTAGAHVGCLPAVGWWGVKGAGDIWRKRRRTSPDFTRPTPSLLCARGESCRDAGGRGESWMDEGGRGEEEIQVALGWQASDVKILADNADLCGRSAGERLL